MTMSSTSRSMLLGLGLLLVMLIAPAKADGDHLAAKFQNFPKWALDAFPTELGGRPSANNFDSRNISEQCTKDIGTYALALLHAQPWALGMLDADFTVPPGVLDGNFHWLGSYDECVRQKATHSTFTASPGWVVEHTFSAKYCRAEWFKDKIFGAFGVCVPDSCSGKDIHTILIANSTQLPVPAIESVGCSGDEPVYENDGSAIAATIILSLFGALVLVATIVDYAKNGKSRSKTSDEPDQIDRSCVGALEETENTKDAAALDEDGNLPAASPEPVSDTVQATTEPTTRFRPTGTADEGASGQEDTVVKFRGNTQRDTDNVENDGSKRRNHFELVESGTEDLAKQKKEAMLLSLLLCFSLRRNIPAVTSAKHPKGSFQCMNGIRFLSMCWILLGHTWILGTYVKPRAEYVASENTLRFGDFFARSSYSVIRNMNLGVEGFFVLSASLTAISFIKQCDRNGGRPTCRQMALYYFHRYWRLTPVYAMIIMTVACFFMLFESGPLFPPGFSEAVGCRRNWWVNLLYVNNFLGLEGTCMGWSWYLANDFQFYVIAPLFVFLLYKVPIIGGIVLLLGFGGHLAATILILGPNPDLGTWYLMYYIKPWGRFGPYAIGMALGYIMYRTKCKQKMHWALVVLGWLFAAFFIIAAVYGDYSRGTAPCGQCNAWSDDLRISYQATFRSFFSLGISWMIFACCSGYGGIVDTILSWKLWIPLGRLTYTGYLLHPIIIYYNMYTRRRLLYVQDSTMSVFFCGYLLMTLGLSFVFTLVFEVPMLHLEKIIIPRKH